MNNNKNVIIILSLFVFLVAGYLVFRGVRKEPFPEEQQAAKVISESSIDAPIPRTVTEATVGIANAKPTASPIRKNSEKQKKQKPGSFKKSTVSEKKKKTKPDDNKSESNTKKKTEKERKGKKSDTVSKPDATLVPDRTVSDTQNVTNVCSLLISCATINQNPERLSGDKKSIIPPDGILFNASSVSFEDSDTVYHLLLRVCRENGIPIDMEGTWTGYIKGIGNIYEKDLGPESGWLYRVNGKFPNVGVKGYKISPNDKIEILYSCNKGDFLNG